MKILTFSIAAYNVEKYLNKLLDSILVAEIIDDIEVLVVSDGSKDNTNSIALEYEKKYPNTVRLIDKENGGHGSTINRGITEAKGKYFRAIDGDDWVVSENMKQLISDLKDENADIILNDYINCYEDGLETRDSYPIKSNKRFSFDEVCTKLKWIQYHGCIYKTNVLKDNNIRLDENCFYVDTEFMAFPIPYVNTLKYLSYPIYCYRLGLQGQSVSPESRKKNINHSRIVSDSLLSFYQEQQSSISLEKTKYLTKGISMHCIWYFMSLMLFSPDANRKKELIEFDTRVKNNCVSIYKAMEQKNELVDQKEITFISFMRLTHYAFYSLYSLAVNIYHKILR